MKKDSVQERFNGVLDGDVVSALVVGSTGQRYHEREVVVFRQTPGLFGTRATGSERLRELTVCNGILNQCTLSEPPTPYWAIVDAMSELKTGFTRTQAIDRAVVTVGEGKRRACELCWDVLRNHHRHARKRDAGMAYMLDVMPGGKLAIRAREVEETLQYFLGEGSRKKVAEAVLARGLLGVDEVVEEGVVGQLGIG
jgi:hypothetical protein